MTLIKIVVQVPRKKDLCSCLIYYLNPVLNPQNEVCLVLGNFTEVFTQTKLYRRWRMEDILMKHIITEYYQTGNKEWYKHREVTKLYIVNVTPSIFIQNKNNIPTLVPMIHHHLELNLNTIRIRFTSKGSTFTKTIK